MIKVEGISFRYTREQTVFANHSFQLESGRSLAILGPNGQGKTTMLKCMIGLLRVDTGSIFIDGEYGYVPQRESSIFSYSVLDMVVMGRARHIPLFTSPKPKDYRIAESVLSMMEMESFAERPFNELSGGERQLVLIARALASECSILVLDEPTSALDFRNQSRVLQVIRGLSQEHGISVVFTTHSPNHAVHAADDVLLMYDPADYRYGTVEEVMTEENLKRLYGLEIRTFEYVHENGKGRAIVPVL